MPRLSSSPSNIASVASKRLFGYVTGIFIARKQCIFIATKASWTGRKGSEIQWRTSCWQGLRYLRRRHRMCLHVPQIYQAGVGEACKAAETRRHGDRVQCRDLRHGIGTMLLSQKDIDKLRNHQEHMKMHSPMGLTHYRGFHQMQ